jgi:hypothetical protein
MFGCHYSDFAGDSQAGRRPVFLVAKYTQKKFEDVARIVAKKQKQEYTPALTCPLSEGESS